MQNVPKFRPEVPPDRVAHGVCWLLSDFGHRGSDTGVAYKMKSGGPPPQAGGSPSSGVAKKMNHGLRTPPTHTPEHENTVPFRNERGGGPSKPPASCAAGQPVPPSSSPSPSPDGHPDISPPRRRRSRSPHRASRRAMTHAEGNPMRAREVSGG